MATSLFTVLSHRGFVLGLGIRKVYLAIIASYKIQIIGVGRTSHGLQGCFCDVANRPGRQTRMQARIIGRVNVNRGWLTGRGLSVKGRYVGPKWHILL